MNAVRALLAGSLVIFPAISAAQDVNLNRPVSAQTAPPPDSSNQKPDSAPTSPLAIHVGDADLLFGGFIDATAIRRDANTGSGVGRRSARFRSAIPCRAT